MNAIAWLVLSAAAGIPADSCCVSMAGGNPTRRSTGSSPTSVAPGRPGPCLSVHRLPWSGPCAGGRRLASIAPGLFPSAIELRLAQRSVDSLVVAALTCSALVGALGPVVVIGVLQALGVVSLGVFVPIGLAVVGLVAGPVAVHTHVVERAREVQTDLRFQLSAYLDVVTMLLAGNSGHEGALEQAARPATDGCSSSSAAGCVKSARRARASSRR